MGLVLPKSSKGVLFSFMALLLVLSLLSLIDALNAQRSDFKAKSALDFSLSSASSGFDNVYSDFALLDKESAARIVDERNLPFKYSMDYNSLSIVQELPLKQSVWNNYFDLINAFEIFAEDCNQDVFFGNFDINVSTVKNSVWGGSAQDLNFVLLPQCLSYGVNAGLSKTGFYPSISNCAFDFSKIKKYFVSVTVKNASLEDYNSITYNIPGFSTPSNPEFEFRFLDTNCSKCAVPSNKTLTGYFDPSQSGWISIKCSGTGCKSKEISIFINSGIQAAHSGEKIDVNFSLAFKNFINSFYFGDFNVSVANKDFGIVYSNA